MFVINGNSASVDMTPVSQYTGEKTQGELQHWALYGADPMKFVLESYGILASRNATLYQISAIARACVNKPLTYSIGKGLFFKSQPDYDFLGMTQEAATEWGKQFTKLLHYEKKYVKFYKKQKQLAKEAKITGDSLLYFVRNPAEKVPFDPVVVNGAVSIDWEHKAPEYTLGIRHDTYGRRVGFWSKTSQKFVPFVDESGNQVAIQFLFPDRAGQLRGFGVYSSEIARSKNLDRVWDAVIHRMIMEATNMGYFNATNTDIASQAKALARQATAQANTDPDTGESLTMREVGGAHASKVGGWYVLENEEAMTFNDMKAPGNNFGIANEWAVNMFGMATAIPPEVIMGKYSTSYTAHRGAFNDFWQIVMNDRNDYTDGVENPVNLEYLKHFVVTGQIEVIPEFWTDYKVQMAYLEGTFLGPVPGHINPLQEVKANAESVKQGFTLRSNIAAQQGNDFWNQIDLWEKEQTRWMEASPDYKEKVLLADIAAKQTSGAFDESDESETMENENLKPKARAVKKDKRDE